MSTILTYGFKKPANPDTGATFWDDLAFDIQQTNDHTHNGVNSAPLVKNQTISSGAWGSDLGGGKYKQTITLPGSLTYDTIGISHRIASGHLAYPTVEKVSSTTYDIYTNDNTISFVAVYT